MARKTIRIDLEAYERLRSVRRGTEPFSQTIMRVVKPETGTKKAKRSDTVPAIDRGLAELEASGGRCINPSCPSRGRRRNAVTRGNCQACDMYFRRHPEKEKKAIGAGHRLPLGKHRVARLRRSRPASDVEEFRKRLEGLSITEIAAEAIEEQIRSRRRPSEVK